MAVRHFRNPVSLARKVMESKHCAFGTDGALKFAMKIGFPILEDPNELISKMAKPGFPPAIPPNAGDTVTAIAIDCNGHLACATSTGGMPDKSEGRIGDAPLVGCGGYANEHGAATICGHGESIIKMTLAREVVYNMEKLGQNAQESAKNAVKKVKMEKRVTPYVGVIAIDKEGNCGIATLDADAMPWATMKDDLLRSGTEPEEIE